MCAHILPLSATVQQGHSIISSAAAIFVMGRGGGRELYDDKHKGVLVVAAVFPRESTNKSDDKFGDSKEIVYA